jgi:heme A synthase
LYIIAIGLVVLFGTGIIQLLARVRGSGLRLIGSIALVAVMIQGLLGGFRVKLNELVGTDLAAVHGVFAQVVLSLMILLAVLTEKPSHSLQSDAQARSLGWWAIALTAILFVQIVWGAIIRHNPTPLTQRLHFLTAFLALAVAVLILRAVFMHTSTRIRVGMIGWVLSGLLVAQLCLGVEAWMMKFGTYTLPELVLPTPENAAIRTLHALIGSGILVSALVLAVRLMRTAKSENRTPSTNNTDWTEQTVAQGRALEIAARFGGNAP